MKRYKHWNKSVYLQCLVNSKISRRYQHLWDPRNTWSKKNARKIQLWSHKNFIFNLKTNIWLHSRRSDTWRVNNLKWCEIILRVILEREKECLKLTLATRLVVMLILESMPPCLLTIWSGSISLFLFDAVIY